MSEYWNSRYKSGGTSGVGSTGPLREWKWNIINKYVKEVDDVVDVGCGDLSFWGERTCTNYIGIDISSVIIERNEKSRPTGKFICTPAEIYQPVKGKIVLCVDMLFHVLNEETYDAILNNLTNYSTGWIFIYTWIRNPFIFSQTRKTILKEGKFRDLILSLTGRLTGDNLYQKYRKFSNYLNIFEQKGFEHLATEKNEIDIFGGLFVFKSRSGIRQALP